MKTAKLFHLLLLILLITQVSLVSSQQLTINLTPLNSSSSLSQNTIQCILKDKYGYMWFGTQDGLNKYDGYKVTIYKHQNNDRKTIAANHIITISEDNEDNIWIGTRTGGISKYDRAQDSFTNFIHNESDASSISNNNINVIYTDLKSNIWIGTESGLNLLDKKTGKFKTFFNNSADKNSISDSNILSIFEDSKHNFWIGTAHGLNLLNIDNGKFTRFIDPPVSKKQTDNSINAITEDGSNNIWVGTNHGLKLLNRAKGSFSGFAIDLDKNSSDGFNPVMCLVRTKGNKLWLGTYTTLQLFDVAKRQLIPLSDQTDGDSRMPNDGIYSLLEDKLGILWIGTSSEGILKYDRNLSLFPSYKASLTNAPSGKNIIRGIAEDKGSNLYLATDVGLDYFNRSNYSYKSYRNNSTNKNSLVSNYTTTVLKSKKNNAVWVGTYSSGLDCLNPETGVFKHYTKGAGASMINDNGIATLLEDRQGQIWVGTYFGGVNVFNPSTKTFTKYVNDDKNPNSICDNAIQALYEDKKGNIWIGGYSNGISIFNPASKTFSQLNTKNSKLKSNIISVFFEDTKGNMWVGTMDGGLNCYQQKTKGFIAFTEQNGLINNTINYITEDAKGNIWLSTNQGIISFDPVKKAFKNFGYYNGLKSLEYNLGAGTKLSNGEIILGSINGFNIIDIQKLATNKNTPHVVITGFELFNKPVNIGQKNSILKQSISTTKEITLQYSQSVFTIEYAGLDYTVPQENKYAYKLENFDKEWRYVGNQRKVTYTNLNPGTYIFKVKAANNDGVWNEKETSLKVIIIPPYWMTWWFRILVSCLILGAAYSFYLYRISFVKKQKAELEKTVQERTHEIAAQAARLEKLNENLQEQTEELQTQSEELQEQAEELQTQSEELQEQAEELQTKTQSLEILNKKLLGQKAAEQKARLLAEKAQQEADKANLAKSTFLATMSHEIRTPMNGVLGMASLLAETPLDIEQREYTEAILNSGESLLSVINDVLDFSKIESGNLELDPHNFELRKCIEDVLELFGAKTAKTGIDLIYHIEDLVPAYIVADSLRLRQVLTNFVGNAIKFTHYGEVFVNVTAQKLAGEEFKIDFEVRDTGIGISESHLKNLFKPFNQLDSSITRKYGGTGLGLVICERLVKLMGGSIKVSSEAGKGTTFSFDINTTKGLDLAQNLTKNNQENIFEGKKALIVDDNATNLKIIQIQLTRRKMTVTPVTSGKEALEILSTQKDFDLIITDMQMPDMEGIELSTRVKAIYNEVPIILLSSIGNESKKLYPHLFAAVLTKPIKQQYFYTVVESILKRDNLLNAEKKKSVLSEEFASEYPFRILVAEDNLMNQKLIIRVLNKLGYQPDLANNGQESLDMMQQKTYDLILMDMQMPELDGLETTRIIRQQYGSTPIILAMTANALGEDKESCLDAGMNDFMTKPINLELLTKTLKDLYYQFKTVNT
jgi:signal transduction histidine kinase/CheY-like chemotaxis protein/ligand-binding sensor domain-containing protein